MTCSTCTPPPPPDGYTRQEATGRATPPRSQEPAITNLANELRAVAPSRGIRNLGTLLSTSFLAGNDITVIALWLGHEQVTTTQIYLHADMSHKQRAIERTRPLGVKPGRYRPSDTMLAFLQAL